MPGSKRVVGSRGIRPLRALAAAGIVALALVGSSTTEAQEARGAWLGVLLEDAVDGGVELVAIVPESPASRAGLRPGDVILAAGEAQVGTVDDLTELLARRGPGDRLSLEVLRLGRTEQRDVLLSARSAPAVPLATLPRPEVAPPAPVAPARFPRRLDRIGLRLAEVTPDLRVHFGAPADAGVLVTDVVSGRAAAAAGVQVGDVLIRLGDEPLQEPRQVERFLLSVARPQGSVDAWVVRSGESRQLRLEWATDRHAPLARPDRPGSVEPNDRVEQAILAEIDRLERRIDELRRELETLREEP